MIIVLYILYLLILFYEPFIIMILSIFVFFMQIRKCKDSSCCIPATLELPWLPDPVLDESGDHYLKMEQVIGTETTDENRPSVNKATNNNRKTTSVNYLMIEEMVNTM